MNEFEKKLIKPAMDTMSAGTDCVTPQFRDGARTSSRVRGTAGAGW